MDWIKEFNLKVAPDRPIHYMIGVASNIQPMSKKRGELFLKYGPIVFINDDIVKLKLAIETSNIKLPQTTIKEALQSYGVSGLVSGLGAFNLSCQVNNCSKHHFSSSLPFTDDYFADLVKNANKSKYSLKMLKDSEVKL